jgi:hypothetical protein
VLRCKQLVRAQTILRAQDLAVSEFGEHRGSSQAAVTAVTFKPHQWIPTICLGWSLASLHASVTAVKPLMKKGGCEDRRLASSGRQAPMRTSQAFETSFRDGSQTPPTSTHLENIQTPHPFGFRSTAFPPAAASCQLYSACYSSVRGSARLWAPHLARTRRSHRLRTLLRRSFGPRTHEGGSTPATVSLLVLSFADSPLLTDTHMPSLC